MDQKPIAYDAVVIGAGNGGLVAAIRLLQKKYKVLVVEKHSVPGGFATSFVRGRFEFEGALHELCDYGSEKNPGGVRTLFEELGVANKIKWCQIPDSYRYIALDKNVDVSMPWGYDAYIQKMEELVPGSRPSMEKVIALAKEVVAAQAYTSAKNGKVTGKEMIEKFPNYIKAGAYTVNQVLKALKVPQRAREIFNAWWVYLGADMDHLSFLHYAAMFHGYEDKPIMIPKDRSHMISLTLAERIYELGGDIWYNTAATKIHTDGNKNVTAVELDNGLVVNTKYIVADIAPNIVYGKMMDQKYITPDINKYVNAQKLAGRGFCVYLGLNKSIEELGIKDYTYLINKYSDSTKNAQYMEKQMDDIAYTAVTVLNVPNPEASPKGTCIISLVALLFNDEWAKATDLTYNDMKNKAAKTLIEFFEKGAGVKISDCIEEIEVASPVTFARYSGAPQGSIYGYYLGRWNDLTSRMQMMAEDQKFHNLYFAGGFSFRGDGYSSAYMSGDIAGRTAAGYLAAKEGK